MRERNQTEGITGILFQMSMNTFKRKRDFEIMYLRGNKLVVCTWNEGDDKLGASLPCLAVDGRPFCLGSTGVAPAGTKGKTK